VSLNPGFDEQRQLALAMERQLARLSAPERRAEIVVGGLYALATALLLVAFPPDFHGVSAAAAAACAVTLLVALTTEFDTTNGFTVPTQVGFVPLLFALPPATVPVIVPAVWLLAKLPEVLRGELRPGRLPLVVANSWFAIGPAAVLALAGDPSPRTAGAALLAGALLAQFGGDAAAAALREALRAGRRVRLRLADLWVYGVDAALAPVGLLAAWALADTPWAPAALLPLIGVLGVFSRERRQRVSGLVELNNAYQGMALVLGEVVEHDDGYTGEHCRAVVALALTAGRRLGLDADRLRNLEFAALLHDVGKVAIPKAIINKPGKLDAAEWELVKTHTIEGQAMLDRVGGFMSEVGRIVRWHHERWDGGGYPDALAGEEIPLEARIITACDSYNAMTTDRAYRAALAPAVAAQELRDCAGSQFDPVVVEAVLAVV
jgi:putative nucleotidyltransferase with HDIG domain